MNWKQIHDHLLKGDLKRHSNRLVVFYVAIGSLSMVISLDYSDNVETYLAAGGGFLLGMSAEKFASRQIRRIATELLQQKNNQK